MKRIFVVGCPRSGTTLLQSLFSKHAKLETFQETHLFSRIDRERGWWAKRLKLVSDTASEKLLKVLREEYELRSLQLKDSNLPRRQKPFIEWYLNKLDDIAHQSHADAWLEKTPGNVRFLHLLPRPENPDDLHVVHIVRDPLAVVASLYHVTREHSGFSDKPWTIERCVDQLGKHLAASLRYVGHDGHHFISYESLVSDPANQVQALIEAVNIRVDFDGAVDGRATFIKKDEPWKEDVGKPVQNANAKRISELFSEDEQARIKVKLESNGIYAMHKTLASQSI